MNNVPTSQSHDREVATKFCDVCIVGAGIAGLNALFVASQYLSSDQRVVLVDRRKRAGGMWVDTYPYVRLHVPYPFFTAGNLKWALGRDRSYLATKNEVLDHLGHCLSIVKQRVRIDELFGWEMESADETDGVIRITCTSSDGQTTVIETKRLIKAYGLRIVPNDPLKVSSTRVQSVSPDFCDMRSEPMRSSDAPVWIAGSGKTAMDTAHALITEYPGREVNLVSGSGTLFLSREKFFPTGHRRWWGGHLISNLGSEISRRFDGTNEAEIWDWHRAKYGTWVTPETGSFLAGVLSESENETIAAGLNEIVSDHVVDAVDRDGGTELVLRSGATKAIQPGSWLVNCTGYLTGKGHPYEPYMSGSGAVLAVQPRSATMHAPSFMAYFMTHLMFLGKMTDAPLYELDMEALASKSKIALPFTLFALVQHNLSVIADCVPTKVLLDCGLDIDRWYPLPRRVRGMARFILTHRRERERLRHTLDTVGERFDVRCGPLMQTAQL